MSDYEDLYPKTTNNGSYNDFNIRPEKAPLESQSEIAAVSTEIRQTVAPVQTAA